MDENIENPEDLPLEIKKFSKDNEEKREKVKNTIKAKLSKFLSDYIKGNLKVKIHHVSTQ